MYFCAICIVIDTFTVYVYMLFFQGDPMDYVERVSENMQLFAPEDVLTGRDFLYEYDPEVCINKNIAKI